MKKLTVYHYPKCGTCRKAIQWFDQKGIETEKIHIVEQPPDKHTLKELIAKSGLSPRKFFNTSGEVYKQIGLKDKIGNMSDEEMIEILASNGKLLKRPIVTDGKQVTVGFKEEDFERVWDG